ncbi:unnamed protein product [Dovyalis caffra]|uniref:Uncharacterized protein n=1 Tax=Dovyalis caffra TaxID=77055 RepID=A0AAV1S0A0_9ROSI|nr:unnamed protein product [Dovyalis caffra]
MAKVAAPGRLFGSVTVQIGGASAALTDGPMVRRKTPSELRGEQLKRTKVVEIVDESPAPLGSKNNSSEVDNGLRKSDASRTPRYIDTRMDEVYPVKKSRLRMLSVKDSAKENTTEQPNGLKNISVLSTLAAKRRQLSCPEISVASDEVLEDGVVQPSQTIEKCSQSIFRSVTQLSSSGEKSSGLAFVDMDKALKGLVAHEAPNASGLNADSSEKAGNHSGSFCSECNIAGQKAPLDFTLKTRMRVASSCSVTWIHRSIMSSTYNGMPQLASEFGDSKDNSSWGQALTSQIHSSKALHSWVYPQSTLPSAVISVLTSSATEGVKCALHNLWRCSLVDQAQEEPNTYAMLTSPGRQEDVCFSMPLCHSKVEQVTTEDLVELSEIEKQNLGQNAALSAPEIKCVEIKRAGHNAASPKESTVKDTESSQGSSIGLLSSIEIKDVCIPSWIVCRICALMGSAGRSFVASFTTERTSIGLNVALETACEKPDQAEAVEGLEESSHAFGIPEATVAPCLRSGFLKGLKYCDGSYMASLSPV